ncbi:Pre-mRNA-splicing factor SPF27 [Terramyces sp. JEL0728]|nr:Pre-mRNA-splicing factor SPF27 [Terramyces sp. JEL0728]
MELDSLVYIDQYDLTEAENLIRKETVYSTTKFDLVQPSKTDAIDLKRFQLNEINLDNIKAQQEYQANRSINLELFSKYGNNQWKLHNYQMEQVNKIREKELEQLKQEIENVNVKRKQEQVNDFNLGILFYKVEEFE